MVTLIYYVQQYLPHKTDPGTTFTGAMYEPIQELFIGHAPCNKQYHTCTHGYQNMLL